ncbi:ATP-binding protein [Massilia sp. BJB1822]|uniref:ATP-binding protein n=1 Tax=Massilia sp. BJB1822 TaxID=2744470 RepID=UPI001594C221|nr:ATP-binding protein [Massilia sp. BJB1822]NVD96594.1 ATP-binding protein [Massilia sp. BJB1822]
MNRLFRRFAVLVTLSISVAAVIAYFVMSWLFGDPQESIARRQAAGQIFLLEQYVDQAPADEWLGRLNKVREVSEVRFDLLPLAAARQLLPAGTRAAFERGEVVIDVRNKAFLRRVDLSGDRYIGSNEEAIHAQDLPIDVGLALKMEAVRYLIVALVVLVPIAVWSRAHWRSLQKLAQMADDFGQGQLAARVHLPASEAIHPLAERFNHMAERIERLLDAQSSLLHSVSHEIRTPIARLEFALELLRDAAQSPALEERIAAMEGDLQELNQLVSELLGMIRMGDQPLKRERFDLAETLRSVADSLPPAAPALDVLVADNVDSYRGDRRLLLRAVCNLMRNAQKYAATRVALSAARRLDGVRIVVEDDGPGIPEAEREKIFDPFYRLDRSRDRSTGGFGLGLSIARKAIELHGGDIAVDSSPMGGARFTIRLPTD